MHSTTERGRGRLRTRCALFAVVLTVLVRGGTEAALTFQELLDQRWTVSYRITMEEMSRLRANTTDHAKTWPNDSGPVDVVIRRTEALLAELKAMPTAPSMSDLESQLAALKAQAPGRRSDTALFKQVCAVRRHVALRNPLLDFDSLVFAGHNRSYPTQYPGCGQIHDEAYMPPANVKYNSGLYLVMNLRSDDPVLVDMLEHAPVQPGGIGDTYVGKTLSNTNSEWQGGATAYTPSLTFNADTVWFAWGVIGRGQFNLFKMALDGSGLKQMTDTDFGNYEACPLPNGKVMFVSCRAGMGNRCGACGHMAGNL